ncbi:MAG: response regulator transcription factor [Cyclobacteriaceae bacterium]|nr:response regulator transcription factor [Cyclobacteriaceae bacterium]
MQKRLIIADDHELFAKGLDNLLKQQGQYTIVAYCKNGKEVLDFLKQATLPHLIILDLNMPVMDGLQLLNHLHRLYPGIKKLVISMHHSQTTMELCKNLNANGFISKDASIEVLLNAINDIIEGKSFFQKIDQNQYPEESYGGYEKLMKTYNLSKREIEIIQLIMNEYESTEIAEKLHLSPLTVKTHRKNIFRKIGVRNLAGLAALFKNFPGSSLALP